jgi:hypothetical protein
LPALAGRAAHAVTTAAVASTAKIFCFFSFKLPPEKYILGNTHKYFLKQIYHYIFTMSINRKIMVIFDKL